jgi:hypothetical protein
VDLKTHVARWRLHRERAQGGDMTKKHLAVGASLLLLFAVACDEEEPTPDPALAFCDSLQTLAGSIEDLEALGPDSTVEDVQGGVDAVSEAAGEVRESAADLAESQVEAIESAVADLESYRDSISEDETVADVIEGLAAQVAAVKQARAEAGQVACGEEEAEAAVEEAQATAAAVQEEAEAAASEAAAQVEEAAEGAEAAAEEAVDEAQEDE